MHKDLDIIHLLKKMKEIDRLKEVLLDSDEKICFDFAPKITIHEKNNKHLNKSRSSVELFRKQCMKREQGFVEDIRDYENLFKSYKQLMKKKGKNITQKKLIENIDPGLIKIFKEEISREEQISLPNEEDSRKNELEKRFLVLPDTNRKVVSFAG